MPVEIKKLVVKYVGDIKEAQAANKQIQQETDQAAKNLTNRMTAMAKGLNPTGLAVSGAIVGGLAAAGTFILGTAKTAAQFGEEMKNLSATTSLSTTTLQQLRYVTKSIGLDFEGAANTAQMLQRKLLGIEADNGMAAEAMGRLGISVKDSSGQLRRMDALFPEVIAKLQGMQNSTERNSIASQLFGRNIAQIAPILAMTRQEYEAMADKASLMSDDDIRQAAEFQRTLNQLQMAFAGVARKAGMEFIPVLQDQIVPLIEEQVIPAVKGFVSITKSGIQELGRIPGGVAVTTALVGLAAAANVAKIAAGGLGYAWGGLVKAKEILLPAVVADTTATTANTVATEADAVTTSNLAKTKALLATDEKLATIASTENTAARTANTAAAAAGTAANAKLAVSFQTVAARAAALIAVGYGLA